VTYLGTSPDGLPVSEFCAKLPKCSEKFRTITSSEMGSPVPQESPFPFKDSATPIPDPLLPYRPPEPTDYPPDQRALDLCRV
jgi:hypothetical protein